MMTDAQEATVPLGRRGTAKLAPASALFHTRQRQSAPPSVTLVGSATFDITPAEGPSFRVRAGPAELVVSAATFEVASSEDYAVVKVVQGTVVVRTADTGWDALVVSAGQRARVGRGERPRRERP